MPKAGKGKAEGGRKRKAALPRDPSPVQDSPSETEIEVESIPEDVTEDIPEDTQETGNASKKQRLHVRLTDEQEDQLASLIQENAHLYDKANKQWLNKEARRQTREEIARIMELPASHLITWFHSMRTRVGRLKKTKSRQGAPKMTDRDRWILRVFDFLCPHIVEVSRRNVVSLKEKVADSMPAETVIRQTSIEVHPDLDDVVDNDYPGPIPNLDDPVPGRSSQPTRPASPQNHPTQPTPATSKRKAPVVAAAAQDDLLLKMHQQSIRTSDLLKQSNDIMSSLRPSGVNERMSFGQWFTNVLVQLPESVYDSLVNDVFDRTKSAKIEARRLQQPEQPQIQQEQQPQIQQPQVQQQCERSYSGWQPPPNQWNPQPTPGVSVWNSMNAEYVQQHYPGYRSSSCPPDSSSPLYHNLQTPTASQDSSLSDSFLSSLGLPRPKPAATATATSRDSDAQPGKDTSK